jgi:outer membrane protein assembly factor BamD
MAKAIQDYHAGKLNRAKNLLDDIKDKCGGSEMMDTAQYYLAMCLMQMNFYPEAKVEFTRLTQDFPRSPFLDESRFRIGYCVLKSSRSIDRDQGEMGEAQRVFKDFLENFPSSPYADSAAKYLKATVERLAEKEFDVARFYQKNDRKEAAIIYYKAFLQDYPASDLGTQARLNMGQLMIELNRKAEAKEVLDELAAQENTGEIAAKIRELLTRCKE